MKIHCINLARAVERRERVERLWVKDKGFEVEFFEAFDRRRIGAEPLPFAYDEAKTVKRIGRPLSAGEIACATSHALLLKHALSAGLDEILVMEDDMVPTANATPAAVAAAIAACQAGFPQVSVLLLHEPAGFMRVSEAKDGIQLLALAPYGYRLVWLKRKAMEVLARDLATLLFPADWLWSLRFAPTKSVAITGTPLCVHPENDTTYIGHDERGHSARVFLP